MRVLLDTCVLFDIIARRMSFEDSCKLLIPHAFGDLELWVSAKSYTDIFYIMRKSVPSEDIQRAFLKSYEMFNVCSVDKTVLESAAKRSWPDFENCLVSVCAEKVEADCIITRDAKGFISSSVPALSPSDLFEWLQTKGVVYDLAAIEG